MHPFRLRDVLAVVPTILALSTAAAAPRLELTHAFDLGGGGCVGETRVYDDATLARSRSKLPTALPTAQGGRTTDATWQALERRLASTSPLYFLTTVGCGADRIAISLNGKAYLLDALRIGELGMPVTYYADAQHSPTVRIERVALLHSIYFKESECTQQFQRVQVEVQFDGLRRRALATAIGSCP